jgi:hypothetical protein
MEVFINCKFARNTNLSYENNYLNTKNEAIIYVKEMKSKVKRKKVYFITVVIGFAICMVGVIFGSRLVFQRTCERRTTPWSDLGTADDDEYRILIDA